MRSHSVPPSDQEIAIAVPDILEVSLLFLLPKCTTLREKYSENESTRIVIHTVLKI